MHAGSRSREELVEVARVLLLVQGSILIATSLEAFLFGLAFAGAPGAAFLFTATASLGLLVARTKPLAVRHGWRRIVYVIEILLLVTTAIDTSLALVITGALPPVMALLARVVLPTAVMVLLRRAARAAAEHVERRLAEVAA